MKDYLGNKIEIGDNAVFGTDQGFVSGIVTNVRHELSDDLGPVVVATLDIKGQSVGIDLYADSIIVITEDMVSEKRRGKLNDVEEGIQVS